MNRDTILLSYHAPVPESTVFTQHSPPFHAVPAIPRSVRRSGAQSAAQRLPAWTSPRRTPAPPQIVKERIEIDANERAVNEKSQYCFFVCTTFDSFLNDLTLYNDCQ